MPAASVGSISSLAVPQPATAALLEQAERAIVARLGPEVLQCRLGIGHHQCDLRPLLARTERQGRSNDGFGVAGLRAERGPVPDR